VRQTLVDFYRSYRFNMFSEGKYDAAGTVVAKTKPVNLVHHRFQLVNHYPPVAAPQARARMPRGRPSSPSRQGTVWAPVHWGNARGYKGLLLPSHMQAALCCSVLPRAQVASCSDCSPAARRCCAAQQQKRLLCVSSCLAHAGSHSSTA